MSEPFVFDSRCELCKTPFGAVATGTSVTLHVRPLLSDGFTHCALIQLHEFAGKRLETELLPDGLDGDRRRFSLTFQAPETPDLVWYCFRFWREDGSGCFLDKTGYRSEGEPVYWQLTVYSAALETPRWFGEGITYQIFPDRFRRLAIPNPNGMVGSRWVHENWEDAPVWRPDPDGEIRNRDFFGGSLKGIADKLDELAALGVTTIYLNPIFESASNHRYNTANYRRIDPMLGTEQDFTELCQEAHKRDIRVILDGVFNHTGSQSVYFNADGFYPTIGAAQSKDSPYYDWYHFHPWPEDYDSWWGIKTLPAVEESTPAYVDYIIEGPDSVVRHWLRAGADGWRLDVADELPDWFIEKIRAVMDETKPGAFLLGEVWEDGSTKIAYSQRRKYLLGHETHGLMNYPFRTAALAWLQGGDAGQFCETMEALRENYPPEAYFSAMNFLGTHDTPRILTVLGARHTPESKADRAAYRLDAREYERGASLSKLAALLLFAFPGSPMIYYGDEAGMEGFEDPLNRGTYPWGRENQDMKDWYTRLGQLRKQHAALRRGDIRWLYAHGPCLCFSRGIDGETLTAVLNAGEKSCHLTIPCHGGSACDLLTGRTFHARHGHLSLPVPPRSGFLLL